MDKLRIAVLRGGPSNEYDVSLQTGAYVLRELLGERYLPLDIFIDRQGTWHHRGLPVEPRNVLKDVDLVFNALHGEYGEDGKVQKLLERIGVPYTGPKALAAALSINKALTKDTLKNVDIPIQRPLHIVVSKEDLAQVNVADLYATFPMPVVIKPLTTGSSVGVSIARDLPSFEEGIKRALRYAPRILIEEYIQGKEATVGVLENFRDKELYALFPVEILLPQETEYYDYNAKYGSGARLLIPGNFSSEEKVLLQEAAALVHRALGLRHYSRSDFIVTPRGIFFLETSALPDIAPNSRFMQSAEAGGIRAEEILQHVIERALKNN